MNNEDMDRIEGLERLARSRAPERDLWPGIAARLKPRRRSPAAALRAAGRHYGLMQFALAASLVAGLAAVFTLSLHRGAGTGLAAEAMPLSHDTRAIVEANLSIVRHTERQIRQALEQDPDSTTLRSLLASTENRQRALSALL